MGRHIHAGPEASVRFFHAGIDFQRTARRVDFLADRQQGCMECLLSHPVHAELDGLAGFEKLLIHLVGSQAKQRFPFIDHIADRLAGFDIST